MESLEQQTINDSGSENICDANLWAVLKLMETIESSDWGKLKMKNKRKKISDSIPQETAEIPENIWDADLWNVSDSVMEQQEIENVGDPSRLYYTNPGNYIPSSGAVSYFIGEWDRWAAGTAAKMAWVVGKLSKAWNADTVNKIAEH